MSDIAYEITLVYDDGDEYTFTLSHPDWLSCMAEAWAQRLAPRDDVPLKVISQERDADEVFASLGSTY